MIFPIHISNKIIWRTTIEFVLDIHKLVQISAGSGFTAAATGGHHKRAVKAQVQLG